MQGVVQNRIIVLKAKDVFFIIQVYAHNFYYSP